jgi:hypothetical protein
VTEIFLLINDNAVLKELCSDCSVSVAWQEIITTDDFCGENFPLGEFHGQADHVKK